LATYNVTMRIIGYIPLNVALAASLLVSSTVAAAAPMPADSALSTQHSALAPASAECFFEFGFKTLHDLIPDIVGNCTTNEMHNPENGDGLQLTTGGLLVWRRVDNWTAFTNGATTWVNGPFGLQSRPNGERFPWEAAAVPAPSPSPPAPSTPVPAQTAVPAQTPEPAPTPPGAVALVQQAIADAAKRTGVDPSAIQVVSVEARDWPDSSLGCPKPGFAYSQIVTPGFRIVLNAAGKQLEYHTDRGQQVVLC
jgi:hypothetical protein